MLKGSGIEKIKCSNICIGLVESQSYAVNQSLCRTRNENVSVEKVKYRWGWWFSGPAASIKSCSKKVKTSLCDVECCRHRVMFKRLGVHSSLSGFRKNLTSYSPPFLKSDQLWSLFFYREGHRLVEKLLLFLFFVINSINISPCAEPMRRDAFFSFWKNLGPGNIRWVSSCSVNWNYHYFVRTINQKKSLSVW